MALTSFNSNLNTVDQDQAARLISTYSNESDDGQICAELCKEEAGLLEILGDYLNDAQQSIPVKEQIFTAFGNICAEMNENCKEAVLKRGHVLDYLQGLDSEDKMNNNIPWLLYNLYC